jgi:uncharacterized membrane protein SpoIIM required for sporulation
VSLAGEFVLWLVRIAGIFGVGFLLLAPVAGLGIASWMVARQRTPARKVVAFVVVSVLVVGAVGAFVLLRPSEQPTPEFPGAEPSLEPESS